MLSASLIASGATGAVFASKQGAAHASEADFCTGGLRGISGQAAMSVTCGDATISQTGGDLRTSRQASTSRPITLAIDRRFTRPVSIVFHYLRTGARARDMSGSRGLQHMQLLAPVVARNGVAPI